MLGVSRMVAPGKYSRSVESLEDSLPNAIRKLHRRSRPRRRDESVSAETQFIDNKLNEASCSTKSQKSVDHIKEDALVANSMF